MRHLRSKPWVVPTIFCFCSGAGVHMWQCIIFCYALGWPPRWLTMLHSILKIVIFWRKDVENFTSNPRRVKCNGGGGGGSFTMHLIYHWEVIQVSTAFVIWIKFVHMTLQSADLVQITNRVYAQRGYNYKCVFDVARITFLFWPRRALLLMIVPN